MQDLILSFAVGLFGFAIGLSTYLRGIYRGAERECAKRAHDYDIMSEAVRVMSALMEKTTPQNSNSDKNDSASNLQ